MIISRFFCPILPKWMDCRMRLWLARRYQPRTVARCYQQGPTRCYQPTPRTGTMSLQIFLNSLALSPLSGVRGVCSLNSTFVGMKRTALTSLYIGLTLLCWLAKWWIQTQYQTAQCKYTSCPSKTFMVWCLYVVLKSIFGHIFLSRTPGIVKGNKSLKISHLVWFKWGSQWRGILKDFPQSRCILISHWSREK